MAIKEMTGKVVDGQSLAESEASAAMLDIVEGVATAPQIAAFAVGLRMKGESADEIAGLARIMRRYATSVDAGDDVIDVVGTGGDGARTFNISTVSSLVVAAAGGRVAKHGNRGVTSTCGSADVLEALGVAIDLPPEGVARSVRETGFGFMFAPLYHPAMKHAAGPRREIGVRTVFNVLGPLTNPAGATAQVTGVADGALVPTIAEVLRLLGTRRALVVHGRDGLDELSISAPTRVNEVVDGQIHEYEIVPEDVGLPRAPGEAVQGGTIEANVRIARAVLAGEGGPPRDVVLLNAAAGLLVAGLVGSLSDGVRTAAEVVDSGAARRTLDQLRAQSGEPRRELVA